jgi:hypothetical protein
MKVIKVKSLIVELKDLTFRDTLLTGDELEIVKFDKPDSESRTVVGYGTVNRIFTGKIVDTVGESGLTFEVKDE